MIVSEYLHVVEQLPLPTSEQSKTFAQYVTWAHSWYKHLPVFPPGVAFLFFLDPNAGLQLQHFLAEERGGFVVLSERDWSDCWHYNMLPTTEYRAKFGFWRFLPLNWDFQEVTHTIPQIYFAEQRRWIEVPDEVVQRCSCRLTAFVHKNGRYYSHPGEELEQKLEELNRSTHEKGENPQSIRYRKLIPCILKKYGKSCPTLFTRTAAICRFRKTGEDVKVEIVRSAQSNSLLVKDRTEKVIERIILEEQAYEQNCILQTLMRATQFYGSLRSIRS